MRLRVEYFMAPASHMDCFESVINVPLKTAWRLWLSTFSARHWSSSHDTQGNTLLKDVLTKDQPQYCWPVSAVLKVRPTRGVVGTSEASDQTRPGDTK